MAAGGNSHARSVENGYNADGSDPWAGTPTKADNAAAKKAARAREQPLHDAYRTGLAEAGGAKKSSGGAASKGAAGRKPVSKVLAPAGGGKLFTPAASAAGAAGSGAGILLGAVAWALVNAYLNYGPAGPRAWLAAKFLNRTGAGVAGTVTQPNGTVTSGPALRTGGPMPVGPSGRLSGTRVAAQ